MLGLCALQNRFGEIALDLTGGGASYLGLAQGEGGRI